MSLIVQKIKDTFSVYALYCLYPIIINKKIYHVSGLRRPGNHAFLNWFSCALIKSEERLLPLPEEKDEFLYSTPRNEVFFLNNIRPKKFDDYSEVPY